MLNVEEMRLLRRVVVKGGAAGQADLTNATPRLHFEERMAHIGNLLDGGHLTAHPVVGGAGPKGTIYHLTAKGRREVRKLNKLGILVLPEDWDTREAG